MPPNSPTICLFPLSCYWTSKIHSRCGGFSVVSHPVSDMEALKTTQQAPSPSFCSFMPDLRGINCLDLFVGVTRGRLKCGFGTCVDPLLLVGFLAGRLPSSSAASSRIVGFGFQSLLEKWKFGGFKFDGCCPLSKFQNLRCHLVAVSFAWKNSGHVELILWCKVGAIVVVWRSLEVVVVLIR